jgi:hypothetical protein
LPVTARLDSRCSDLSGLFITLGLPGDGPRALPIAVLLAREIGSRRQTTNDKMQTSSLGKGNANAGTSTHDGLYCRPDVRKLGFCC